ncbi:ribbon-helix-helix protein, CopG family [Halorubrum sp. RMP-47]|uniref:ribbon-helix-helix protein, CopG family n=1 Tax=Halorubrum miltondacostae TaxID=3076378 RepID=UPI0035295F3F
MEPITIRIQEDTKESLESEADEYDVSVSEYIRRLIRKGREYDDLEAEVDAKQDRIRQLEEQLSRRSQIEEKIENLPDVIRQGESYQERRQRLLDTAPLSRRLKWKLTGVPVERIDAETEVDSREK